jgi:hypothetical protein
MGSAVAAVVVATTAAELGAVALVALVVLKAGHSAEISIPSSAQSSFLGKAVARLLDLVP